MSRWMNRLSGRVYGWFESKEARTAVKPMPAQFRKTRLAMLDLEERSVPATFTVLNTADSGYGSLRWAWLSANGTPGADTINFNTNAAIGTDFSSGINSILLATALPVSSSTAGENLTITGPGANKLLIAPLSTSLNLRAFAFGGGSNLFEVTDLTISSFSTSSTGGAIDVTSTGNLTLNRVTLSGNTASSTSGGSALYLSNGTHNILNSAIISNVAAATSTTSTTNGGAIRMTGTTAGNTLTITNSTIAGNTGVNYGGINLAGLTGTVNINNSTIALNSATVTGTSAASAGWGAGGIGRATTTGSVTLTVNSSIVAGNSSAMNRPDIAFSPTVTATISTTLIGLNDTFTYSDGGGNKTDDDVTPGVPLDPQLSLPSHHNGSSTPMLVPLGRNPASLAIGNGTDAPDNKDQTGATRAAPFDMGSVEVTPGTPFAAIQPLPNVFSPGGTVYGFSVNLYDNIGINGATIDNFDFRVTGPNGFNVLATNTGYDSLNQIATYEFTPPGGSWDSADFGLFAVSLEANQIKNSGGTAAVAGLEGAFFVGPAAPVAAAPSLPVVTAGGGTTYTFTVTYTDLLGTPISAATLDNSDVRVKGPGFNTLATFVSATPVGDATPLTATYKFTAPGGSWDASENGNQYTVFLENAQVANTSGIFVVSGSVGSFPVAFGSTFTVTNNGDNGGVNPNPGDGTGTLRQAIVDANANPYSPDTIVFNDDFKVAQVIDLSAALPSINGSVTITGKGSNLLTLQRLTGVTTGFSILNANFPTGVATLAISGMSLIGNSGSNVSAIVTNDEIVTLTDLNISKTTVTGSGGGVNVGPAGVLTLVNSVISGNSVSSSGGGILAGAGATVSIHKSTIHGNTAGTSGGGIAFTSTTGNQNLAITDSTLSANTANTTTTTSGGGAIFFAGNVGPQGVLIRNSTISGNKAISGGGITLSSLVGTVNVQNSTIISNVATATVTTAGTGGGGIAITGTDATVLNLVSNLISGNSHGSGKNDLSLGTNAVLAATYNAITDQNDFAALDGTNLTAAEATAVNLNYGPLQINNGGTTKTHALLAGSSALERGFNPTNITPALTTDQNGNPRVLPPSVGLIDVGSFERSGGVPNAVAGPLPTVDNTNYTTLNSYSFTVTYTDDIAINRLTIDGADIIVSKVGGGFSTAATFVSMNPSGVNTSPIVATYKFTAPGGSWDLGDNGSYDLNLQANQVKNTGGVPVVAATLGTITVAAPEIFTVTNTLDNGAGSLRQAILDANATTLGDIIVFDAPFSGGVRAISMGGTAMTISESLIITGPGADKLTINGNNKSQIFNVNNASAIIAVTISGLSLTRGQAADGGAILTNNEKVTLRGLHIYGNSATSEGGGVAALAGGSLTILDSAITANTATTSGAGVNIIGTTNGSLLMRNSTVANNLVTSTTGGAGINGASWIATASMTIENSTITGNTAAGSGADGGGIRVSSATGAPVTLISSVVAGNAFGTGTAFGADIALGTAVGTVGKLDATNSAIGTADGYILNTDLNNIPVGTPLLLEVLNLNGGPTPTVGFDPASPLREAGANPNGLTTDQRGSARTVGLIDIGAYEMVVGQPHSKTGAFADLVGIPAPASKPYTFTVTYFNDSSSNINVGTLGTGDVRVYGPNGFSTLATFKSVDDGTNGSPRVATYEFTPNGGAWDITDTGLYSITVEANEVKSSGGTAAPVSPVGSFRFVVPQTFVVTNTFDSGAGSLRQAILDANDNFGVPDIIAFEASTFSTPQVIPLIGEALITDSLTILGPGKDLLTLTGGVANRIFNINGLGTLDVTIQDVKLSDGSITGAGGAVVIQDENVTFLRTIFSGNQATTNGGAISVTTPLNSTLTILDSVLTNNSATTAASGDGGAIRVGSPAVGNTGHLIVRNSELSNNTAMDDGGAILLLTRTSLLLENSTLSGNSIGVLGSTSTTPDGAAVYFIGIVGSPGFTIRNSTISGNSAGPGNNNSTSVSSALGLPLVDGAVLIQNSTIVNNTASSLSPDVFDGGGGIAISNASGATGILTLESSIVAGNSSINGHPDLSSQSPVVSIHSAIGAAAGHKLDAASTENVAYGVDLKLGALANNGGPAFTHLPAANSPLLDRGSNPAALAKDQRGVARTTALTDIGAVEAGQSLVPFGFINAPAVVLNDTTYTFTVKYYDTVTGINTTTVDDGDEVRVTGPNGFDVFAKFVSIDNPANGSPRTATYSFTAPGGAWNDADNGTYNFALQANQVKSVGGVAAFAETIGTLSVGFPGTLTVTNTDDSGTGSLRDAVTLANATPEADLIVFSPLFNSAQTITLSSGALAITEPLTIDGPGANLLTIDAAGTSRVFSISGATTKIDVTLRDMKVTGGFAAGGGTATRGGGIDFTDENVTIDSMWITGNTSSGVGGGISNSVNGGNLTLLNSTVDNNVAQGGDSTYGGGGILTNLGGDIVIRNSTIAYNTASATTAVGGGLVIYSGTDSVTIENSTFVGNTATSNGGGVRIFGGTPTTILNTIIAENLSNTANKDLFFSSATTFDLNYSAVGTMSGGTLSGTSGNNISDVGLVLGPLQNNGGPMPTIALGAGSTAINAGPATSSFAFDQRGTGFPRLVGPAVDIGAFENQSAVAPAVTGFTVNNGAAQRSRLTTITVTFNQPVTAAAFNALGAITLTRTAATPTGVVGTVVQTGAAGANGLITVSQPGPTDQLVLTFSNANASNESAGVEYGSLADGRWQLAIGSAGFTSNLGDPTLRRLFGDFEGGPGSNGTVDAGDFADFGTAFGSSGPIGFSPFDYDNNGTIDSGDLGAFGARFGFSV